MHKYLMILCVRKEGSTGAFSDTFETTVVAMSLDTAYRMAADEAAIAGWQYSGHGSWERLPLSVGGAS